MATGGGCSIRRYYQQPTGIKSKLPSTVVYDTIMRVFNRIQLYSSIASDSGLHSLIVDPFLYCIEFVGGKLVQTAFDSNCTLMKLTVFIFDVHVSLVF